MAEGKPAKRLTSADIARLANVSRATVSFVLNDTPNVSISERTRNQVLAAAAALDYHPSETARALRTRSSHILGLTMPDGVSPYFEEIMVGADACARAHGYSIFRHISYFDVEEERRSVQWLKQGRIDALIVSSSALAADLVTLHNDGYCVLGLGVTADSFDCVHHESGVGETQIIDHLVALGHRRIGHIYGVADHATLTWRLDALLAAQRAHGLPILPEWIQRCGPTMPDAHDATQRLLEEGTGLRRPTALVVTNDLLATATLNALHAAGVAVPTEMSVASFDNSLLASYTIPPLTTVDGQARALGMEACRLVIARLADRQRPATQINLPARLIVRSSTGPAASE